MFTRGMKVNDVNHILRKSEIGTLKTNPYDLPLNKQRTKMPSSARLGQDSQPSLAGSSWRQSVPLGSPVPHRKELPSHTQRTTMPSPGPVKPLPPASPAWHQRHLGEQALPPASAQEAAGWASLAPNSSPRSSYLLSGSKHFCSSLYSKPRSSKRFFFFFCLSLEPLAWLPLHRTGREAPAKRAVPLTMCRAPVCILCKGSLSML